MWLHAGTSAHRHARTVVMKLSCCSWSYHRAMEAKRLSFEQWLTICAQELCVGGVDIIAEQMPRRTKSYWIDTKKRCTDLQLSIASLSPGNDFGKPTARARAAEVENIVRWIDTALLMGAPCLRIFAGWPPRRDARAWDAMAGCIRTLAGKAAQAGVTLVIEPHNHGGFLATSQTTLTLIKQLDSPWVRINLDTGNFQDPDPYAGLEACLPWSPHVVAKIHDLNRAGEDGRLDYDRIFAMLARHHYRGFITIEYEGKANELRAVPKAVAMLRRYGAKHGL